MKYALIGCGRIAPNHIDAAKKNGLEIVALCDIEKEKIDALIEKTCPELANIEKYTDHKAMLAAHPELELIAVATISGEHARIALDCIDAGKNVIIEKPIAMSIQDADEIVRRGREKGVVVCANHQNRFNEAILAVKRAEDEGRFGKLSHGSIQVRWHRDKAYFDQASWRGTWKDDGGCLMNQCIHGVDLLRWLMGDDPVEVYGVTRNIMHDYIECEDIGMAVVKFASGAVATIEGTTNIYRDDLEGALSVFGTNGAVRLGGLTSNEVITWDFADGIPYDGAAAEKLKNVYGTGHRRVYSDVIESIQTGKKPFVDAVAGRNALEMILAIYKSAATGKPVKLPMENCSTMDFAGGKV